ncbi:MAG TPA: cyanophycinase [Thermodesulfobacteriota bacterium]|nr:cyanophycinase [Thermodesulfobacteriota bacterium]
MKTEESPGTGAETGKPGPLIIIGGHEEKERDRPKAILEKIAVISAGERRKIVVVTVATNLPEEVGRDYCQTFRLIGCPEVEVLDIRKRDDAFTPESLGKLDGAAVVFFTGGDQLRITSKLAGTPVLRKIRNLNEGGTAIAGTSAGAAAMSEHMIAAGPARVTEKISEIVLYAGLGLMRGAVIDSHFSERGRFGRLCAAVAQKPGEMGIGIDEDTAIFVAEGSFFVIGSGCVYIVDASESTYSSLLEKPEGGITVFNTRVHVLASGHKFDLEQRKPISRRE